MVVKLDQQFHPIANIFPMMPEEELMMLVEDIKANGQHEPIIMFDGKVLDGRNRWMACKLAGVTPFTKPFSGSNEEALAFVWSENVRRRHLNSSQIAIAEAERAKLDEQYRQAVQGIKAAASKGGRPKMDADEKPVKLISPVSKEGSKTVAKRAASVGTNKTYVQAADKIVEQRPDLAAKIKKGDLTIPQAKVEIKRQEKREKLSKAAAVQQHKQEAPEWTIIQGDVLRVVPGQLEEFGLADLIIADPPYNIGIDYGDGKSADMLPQAEYIDWCRKWIRACRECISPRGAFWVIINDENAAEIAVSLKAAGFIVRNWVKWYETFGTNCSDKFNRTSRHLFYCVVDSKSFTFNPDPVSRPSARQEKYGDKRAAEGGKLWDDVWEIPRLSGTCDERIPDFPTQLPLALVRPIVQCCSMPGDLVLDPFSGSATTGVAAISNGRKFIGVEKNDLFVDLSEKRMRCCSDV